MRRDYRRVLIAIEGVYSMDGDYPDLPRFIEVKKRHKAFLMIDEAHSHRRAGRARPRHRRALRRRSERCRHLDGHAQQVVRQLRRLHRRLQGPGRIPEVHGSGFVFASAFSPPNAAAALAALRLLEDEPERVDAAGSERAGCS